MPANGRNSKRSGCECLQPSREKWDQCTHFLHKRLGKYCYDRVGAAQCFIVHVNQLEQLPIHT